ncbi:MAG: hypothetical protein PHT99_05050 [Methanoregula sp.]|nr:hypothetical protein [Methanoregula sp.]
MRIKKKTIRIICAAVLAMFVMGLAAGTLFAESAPGTRVVKATLPGDGQTAGKTDAGKSMKPDPNTGKAGLSEYTTTGIDSTVQEKAARVWIFGVLGGDREYLTEAPSLFKTEGQKISEQNAVRFIVLREALYTASSWAVGQARIESLEKNEAGIAAKLYIVDVEPLISGYAAEISDSLRVSGPTARILAEWKAASELKDPEKVGALRHNETVKQIPVNAYGKLSLDPELLKQLVLAPEKEAVLAVAAAKKYKLAYAKPYIEALAFIVRYSSSLEFPKELTEALKDR